MSDNLRDRIAAVQREHFPSKDGLSCDCLVQLPGGDLDDEPFRLHLADAVIAELGLRVQVAGPDGIAHGQHRYISDWITNE